MANKNNNKASSKSSSNSGKITIQGAHKALVNSGPSKAPNGNPVNRSIQAELGSAGKNVNYLEASTIAQKLGVSVDRVFNQTARTGQGARIGAAAVNAGYTGENSKVNVAQTGGYQIANYANQINQLQEQTNQLKDDSQAQLKELLAQPAQGYVDPNAPQSQATSQIPSFDWADWNNKMMAQQAAVWESMDAMNSEFLRQQQAYLEQQRNQPSYGRAFGGSGGSSADPATVRRKKSTKGSAGLKTNTGLGTGSAGGAGGSGLSLGGANSGNGLSIGKP